MRKVSVAFAAVCSLFLSGCGTLTGIPSHGGGKRFAIEQKLVSASIRNTLRSIDVSPLRGRKVALIFDLISDEGGGNLSGGRLSLMGLARAATVFSPVTSTMNQFQVFDLVATQTNYQNVNTGTTGSSTAVTTTISSGNTTTSSSGRDTSSTSSSGTTNLGSVTTTTNGTSSDHTTTTTGSVTTNQNSTGSSSSTANTSASTNTTSSNSNTNGTSSSTASSNSSSNSTSNNNSNSTSNTNSAANGGYTLNSQDISPGPVLSRVKKRGPDRKAGVRLEYRGLGDYHNLAVPKSDASLLMGLVRNYLLLNGVQVTVPTDPSAQAIVYVTVDVFGIVRSRFDAYIYNRETVKAETAIEMMAFDKHGRLIMRPSSANEEASYNERYLLWAGPFLTDKSTHKGEGLLVDFRDVGISRRRGPRDKVLYGNGITP